MLILVIRKVKLVHIKDENNSYAIILIERSKREKIKEKRLIMKHYKIKRENYKTTDWSGGKTTEIFIYPKESSLSERDFDFRFSSATVNLEESTFTRFEGYKRILMILDGKIKISHENSEGIREKEMLPYSQDFFDGEEVTRSYGRCRDFNIIYKKSISADLRILNEGSLEIESSKVYVIYCNSETEISLKLTKEEENVHISLNEADSYIIENCEAILRIEKVLNENKNNSLLISSIEF